MMKNDLKLSDVVKLAAETAVVTAMEHLEKEKRQQQKAKHDWRLRNTKLLLKHYRSFLLHCEDIKLELETIDHELLNDLDSDEFAVGAIKQSKQKTLVIVNFIQQMMWVYRIVCEKSADPEAMRRYQTIDKVYISDDTQTPREVAECQNTDVRTVYRDINRACEALSTLMFGVDGVRLVD